MTTKLLNLNPVPLEVTYDQPGLLVAMRVLKYDGVDWVQQGDLIPAVSTPALNTYAAIFTPARVGLFICELMVYEDVAFTTPQDGYYPSTRSFAVDLELTNRLDSIETILNNLSLLVSGAVNPTTNVVGEVGGDVIEGTVMTEGDII